jgi:hypothetical protein
MNIFISWSGARGQHLAQVLCNWLPMVLPHAKPWLSTRLNRGANWSVELLDRLRDSAVCLFCITSDSLDSTWLPFEAGMLRGTDTEPVLARCVCLDVHPSVLAHGPLRHVTAISWNRGNIWKLLGELNAAMPDPLPLDELEQGFDDSMVELNKQLESLPQVSARPIRFVVQTPVGLCPIETRATEDTTWSHLVSELGKSAAELTETAVADLSTFKCLDLDAATWVQPPIVIAQLKALRIALLDPANLQGEWQQNARSIALQLRHTLEIQPAQAAASASMRRDLQDLVRLQAEFHQQHQRYAASLDSLDFYPSPGTRIELNTGEQGFHAIATRDDFPAPLAVRIGDGAGSFQDQTESSVFIPQFESSSFYVSQPGSDP